jgi:hypothetical protein
MTQKENAEEFHYENSTLGLSHPITEGLSVVVPGLPELHRRTRLAFFNTEGECRRVQLKAVNT